MLRFLQAAAAGVVCAGVLGAAGCASHASGPVWTVVEERAEIADRSLVRRISILDDDELLIESAVNEYYRVRLVPACASFADLLAPVRVAETGIGIDRSTRFLIGGRECGVRSIERVERVKPGAGAGAGESGA